MIFINKKKLYFLSLCSLIILFDQLTKYFISVNFQTYNDKDFILFNLDFVKNYGAAFNILDGNRIFLSIISVIFSLILIFLIIRKNNTSIIDLYCYTFILGGTIGNGVDRIIKGYVVDFINLNFVSFPVFNIADISINIGFIIILYKLINNK